MRNLQEKYILVLQELIELENEKNVKDILNSIKKERVLFSKRKKPF